MSRSNNTELKNPAKKTFEWKGKKGIFQYYDKESKLSVDVKLPFTFLVLDELSCVGGFSKEDSSGYFSNEIRHTKTDTLTVRTKKGICATGLYNDVILQKSCKGSKYNKSVYIAYMEGKDLAIGRLLLEGSSSGAWIDFSKKKDLTKCAIFVAKSIEEKNGDNTYLVPVYETKEVTKETNDKALALDLELQEFLRVYLKKDSGSEAAEDNPVASSELEVAATKTAAPTARVIEGEDFGDLPF